MKQLVNVIPVLLMARIILPSVKNQNDLVNIIVIIEQRVLLVIGVSHPKLERKMMDNVYGAIFFVGLAITLSWVGLALWYWMGNDKNG